MDFFKPEDFDNNPNSIKSEQALICLQEIADQANAKLEKVVFILKVQMGPGHKDILSNIEPMEECTHPKEKVVIKCNEKTGIAFYECACGVEVITETFKAKNEG